MQVYAAGRRLFDVAAGAFHPPPKVRSSVIRLDVLPEPLVPRTEIPRFFEVARAGFSAPRKQLRNSLAQGLGLSPDVARAAIVAVGLDPGLRPGALSVDDWLRLKRGFDAAQA